MPTITQQLDLKGFQLWTNHARGLPLVFPLFCFFDVAGCIQSGEEDWGGVGDYQVSADWYVIEVETKTEYYPDGENVSWSIESSLVSESINSGGGNVVGMLFSFELSE